MKIVVFSDGTGNSSAKLFRTNVWRLYEALDLCNDANQVAFYDNGVGTASFKPLAVLGGAFGFGLKRNVLDIYTFICRNVAKPGEHKIYAFGFSRGAFTIRVLLGLIKRQGLVPHDGDERRLRRMATWAYREYRAEATREKASRIVRVLRWFRDRILNRFDAVRRVDRYDRRNNRDDVRIGFVGLWDTVAAYGFPIIEMTRGWDRWVWPLSLPTRELAPQVDKACHAVALDDERQTFHPLLWNEDHEPSIWRGPRDGRDSIGKIADERLSQVWFAGMHSNVGGGYPDDGMAYETLCWIAEHAVNDGKGLVLKPGSLDDWRRRCTPSAPMADSRSGIGMYYRYLPRLVAGLTRDDIHEVEITRPKIHASVLRRIRARIDGYAPIVLPKNYVVTDGHDIFDLPVAVPMPGQAIETADQAVERNASQEQVWDSVWYRRIAYFLTVGVTAALIVLALTANDSVLTWQLPTVSGTIALLSGLVPGFAAPLIDHFVKYPLQLLFFGGAAILLMMFSSWVENRNSDRMRRIWRREPTPPPSIFLRFSRAVRTSPLYVKALNALRYAIAPNVFGFAMVVFVLWMIAVLIVRVSYNGPMLVGRLCKDLPNVVGVEDAQVALQPFDTKLLCQPMGVWLQRNQTYVLSVEPATLAWKDRSRDVTDVKGFKSDSLLFYLAVPIRRHKIVDWFVPMARIGPYGDHYFAITQTPAEITPQVDGQLFMYVNDALSVYPSTFFYDNNANNPLAEKWSIKRKTTP